MNTSRVAVLSLAVLLTACSSEQLYRAGQAWQRNECYKLADQQERTRCLSSAATSYEQYRRESQASPAAK